MIQINQELSNYLTPISDVEFNGLIKSIKNKGQQVPITVGYLADNTNELFIVDGHNRYKACQELGIEPVLSEPIVYDSMSAIKYAMLDINDLRRKAMSNLQRQDFIKSLDKQGLLTTHGGNRKTNQGDIVPLMTNKELANIANTSVKTIKRDRAVNKAKDYIMQTLQTNEITCCKSDTDITNKYKAVNAIIDAKSENEFVEAITNARHLMTKSELELAKIKYNNALSLQTAEQQRQAEIKARRIARIENATAEAIKTINMCLPNADERLDVITNLIGHYK